MPSQSSNLTALRSSHTARVYMSLLTGASVLTGTVSADADETSALNIAYTTFYTMDAGKFVRRVGYVYVAVLLAGFLHLKFFYNPIDVGQAKAEWKAKQAAKAAASKSK